MCVSLHNVDRGMWPFSTRLNIYMELQNQELYEQCDIDSVAFVTDLWKVANLVIVSPLGAAAQQSVVLVMVLLIRFDSVGDSSWHIRR